MKNNKKVFHPGVYIKDSLEALGMTSREFSLRTGISERTLSSIINAKGDITFDVNYKLSKFFGCSDTLWSNLQTAYNVYIREKEDKKIYCRDIQLALSLKNYLLENDYIKENDNDEYILDICKNISHVNTLISLDKEDPFLIYKNNTKKDNFYQNFWISTALNEARKNIDLSYNKKVLLKSIEEIRGMTLKEPSYFYPRLKEIFKCAGISFVILPYLDGSNIYGITKWLNSKNVMIAISNMNERADIFWITLFTEISNLLLEKKREMLIDIIDDDVIKSSRGLNILIPDDKWIEFVNDNIFTIESINAFSKRINILPSIVLNKIKMEIKDFSFYEEFDKKLNITYSNKENNEIFIKHYKMVIKE